MKLKFLFLIQLLKLSSSTDRVDKNEDAFRSDVSVYSGFPIAILCDQFNLQFEDSLEEDCEGSGGFIHPDYSDDTQCVITRNGVILFNETFTWEDAHEKGFFVTPDKTWNGDEISVLVKWPADPEDGQLFVITMNVKDSNEYNCSNVIEETHEEIVEIGEERVLFCFAPHGLYMNEVQFNTITTVWYHDCEEIKRDNIDFEYEDVKYYFSGIDSIEFDKLKIRNTSLSKTPGKYYCALKIVDLELPSRGYEVCLKEKFTPNLPIIVVGHEEYKATLGSTLNVTCYGHTGTEYISLSQNVNWHKYEKVNGNQIKVSKCVDLLWSSSTDGNCSSVLHKNKEYCTPLSAEEIDHVKNDYVDDNFIATYTLRGVTEADSGIYACELVTTQGRISQNFMVDVEKNIEDVRNEIKDDLVMTPEVVSADFTAYKGFPIAILCNQFTLLRDYQEYEYLYDTSGYADGESGSPMSPNDTDETQCIITKNGVTLFNETFIWEDASEKGIFDTPDDTWNGEEISVQVKWHTGPENGQLFILTINIKDSNEHSCSNVIVEIKDVAQEVGKEHTLNCFAPLGMHMNENQFHTITTVWYHDCEKIERDNVDFGYEEVEYSFNVMDDIEFDSLKIRNTSLSKTPGQYYCALKFGNLELPSRGYEVCLKEKFRPNLQIIVVGQEEYKATPGSTFNVTCSGHTGMESDSLSQDVRWYKYEEINGTMVKVRKCVGRRSTLSMDGNCTFVFHENKEYCTPLSAEDLDNVANDILDDNFIATYTLRDVSEADSGTYACELRTTRSPRNTNFTVDIEERIQNEFAIALGVVGGCILIAIVFILLFHVYKTPILYFLKHHFAPYETMDRQYTSYMVYTPDVFNMENNMLKDTYQHVNQLNHPVYDPNNNADHAGAPVGDQILENLRQCMTVILIVTPDLLQLAHQFNHDGNGNEEILAVYQALEKNVENYNMWLVFICSKITKRNIDAEARMGNNFCVMLQRFMKRQGNSVILWKANNQKAFHRALYVAMPKVRQREKQPKVMYNVALEAI